MHENCILVTGVGGFIGAALTERLIKNGENVIGIDNLNSYYDQNLKRDRLNELDSISKEINKILRQLRQIAKLGKP